MPIYEYRCEKCGCRFESLVFGAETPGCPSCECREVNKLMSACSFVSKGSRGETTRTAAADTSCGGCAATSCAGCGH